jgi:hypothetical protein
MKTKLLLITGVFVFLLYSCPIPGELAKLANYPARKFWAQNISTNNFYQLDAERLYQGRYCNIWAEKGSGVNADTAQAIANEYDNVIYPKMMRAFGTDFNFGQNRILNTMELADYLHDGDGKLCILLLDIQDSYQKGVNDSYVGGYFDGNNYRNYEHSNRCDMIYVDTYPGKPGTSESNETLAHEMQHLMNFATSFVTRMNEGNVTLMNTWVNEGLSSAAEWLYSGKHPSNRLSYYNNTQSGLISRGNNFFVWGNRANENQYAILDDYSTGYLFFQWLRLQSGGTAIYRDIITSSHHNYQAVTSAANKTIPGKGYDTWGTLLKTWLAANYIRASAGPYGYIGDSELNNIVRYSVPAGQTTIPLYPGEAVYSKTAPNAAMPSPGTNIRYASLSANGEVSDTSIYADGVLLTYNVNTNTDGRTETGITAGVPGADMSASVLSGNRAVQPLLSGPHRICGTPILGQNDGWQVVIDE